MKLEEWQSTAIGTDMWARMKQTKPGALSLVVAQLLYDAAWESIEHRGRVMKVSNSERAYVSGLDDKQGWPKFEGRDGNYADYKKALYEIQKLLEAYAFREINPR